MKISKKISYHIVQIFLQPILWDFLIQEMNREVNTIGSKASDLEITQAVVAAKSEIEKLREQVQNVE